MARIGQNPYKTSQPIPAAPAVSLCVVTHYTDDKYHAGRMEVVRMCLDSMLASVMGIDYELIIWDNASTPEFRGMLQNYNPTVFVQSQNIGAHNAEHALAGLARGRILCMSDDDILFAPDWYAQQLEVLQTYPKVGAVSGSPQRTAFRWGVSSNIDFARRVKASMVTGRLIPDEWERDYCLSVQRNVIEHAKTTAHEIDCTIEYNGVKTWAHGHHMQWMGYREIAGRFLFTTPVLLGDGRKFNIDLNAAGYLNLTTYERTALHIGNVVDDNIRKIARSMGQKVTNEEIKPNVSEIQRRRLASERAGA